MTAQSSTRTGGHYLAAGLTCALAFVLAGVSAGSLVLRLPTPAEASPRAAVEAGPGAGPEVTHAAADITLFEEPPELRAPSAAQLQSEDRAAVPMPDPIEPSRVAVPAIGLDAEVIRLGLNPDGTLEVPSDFSQSGWWTGGSAPGEPGPAVIAGHVDSRSGPAVFYYLRDLSPGDLITVSDENGEEISYEVDRVEQHPKDAFPTQAVYGPTDESTLRLITCGGSFDRSVRSYRDNIIVFASIVGPANDRSAH